MKSKFQLAKSFPWEIDSLDRMRCMCLPIGWRQHGCAWACL